MWVVCWYVSPSSFSPATSISTALYDVEREELSGIEGSREVVVLMAYHSLVNANIALRCYAQGWRNVRPKRAICPDCERGHGKGKGKRTSGDGDQALLRDSEEEAGPSGQVAQAPYRDQEEGGGPV